MSEQRETAFMTVTRLDVPDAPPEQVEVYVDDGSWVNPPPPAPSPSELPDDHPVMMTRGELDAMMTQVAAAAAEAAVAAVIEVQNAVNP